MALKNKMRGYFQYKSRSIPPLRQEQPNPSRKCKFFSATLKDVFCNCRRFSNSSPEEEYPASELELEQEQEVVVSEIRSRAMEKLKHRTFVITDSFSWVYSPKTGELFIATKPVRGKYEGEDGSKEGDDGSKEGDEREEYLSVGTCFSCCASDFSREQAFFSARTNFSRCSSLVGLEFQDFPKRSIFQELCHCEGWPFGLCRKAVLLPPLPKSPSESWSWRKDARIVKAV